MLFRSAVAFFCSYGGCAGLPFVGFSWASEILTTFPTRLAAAERSDDLTAPRWVRVLPVLRDRVRFLFPSARSNCAANDRDSRNMKLVSLPGRKPWEDSESEYDLQA